MNVFISEQFKKNNINEDKDNEDDTEVKLKLHEAIDKLSEYKDDLLSIKISIKKKPNLILN